VGVGDRALSAEFHQQQGDTDDDGGCTEYTGNNARPGSVAVVARASAGGSTIPPELRSYTEAGITSWLTAANYYRWSVNCVGEFVALGSWACLARVLQ